MLAVELRSEKSRGLPQDRVRSLELTHLRLKLDHPLPITHLITLLGHAGSRPRRQQA
jgi:hypothetical protein